MSSKPRNDSERFERILDGLGDYIVGASAQELVEDAREENRDPNEISTRVKGILNSAFKAHQQVGLQAAKEGYKREIAAMAACNFELPNTTEGRRSLLFAALTQLPQLQPAFTLQNRDFTTLSDQDVESHLKKLAQLGALNKISVPKEK